MDKLPEMNRQQNHKHAVTGYLFAECYVRAGQGGAGQLSSDHPRDGVIDSRECQATSSWKHLQVCNTVALCYPLQRSISPQLYGYTD